VELHKVCKRVYGLDQAPARYSDDVVMDIEAEELPRYADVEVVLLAEVLEHLVSPGVLLWQVREQYPQCHVIVTVPNAYSAAAQTWIRRGYENVNSDHVAWYSQQTLGVLLAKCGLTVQERYWYGGKPGIAEGIIAVAFLHA
jgi:Methyltransferase domain